MEEPPADEAKTPIGCFLALAIGPLVAGGTAVAFSLLRGRSLSGEWGMIAVDALLASIPFIAVALTGTLRNEPWLVGLALTIALWGYILYEGVSYQWHPAGTSSTGAALRLGVILFASTFFITAICLGVHWLQRRNAR